MIQQREPSERTLHVGDDGHRLDPDPLRRLVEDLGEPLGLLESFLVTPLAPLHIHYQLTDALRNLTTVLVTMIMIVMIVRVTRPSC